MANTQFGRLLVETVDAATSDDSFLVSRLVFPNGSLQASGADSAEVDFGSGTGDVVGPASAVNDRVAVFDGTTGKLIKDGGSTIADIVAGVGAAPLGATYITQTPNATLTNEQALSALATGLLKNTTTTGVLTIAVAGTDYLTPTGNGSGLTSLNGANLQDNTVSLAKLVDIATASFLGRNTAGTGDPEVLSIATAKTMLNLTGTNSGDVTLAGETYLSIAGQVITANAVNLAGSNVTGTLTVNKGGTGAATFTANGVLYGNTTSAIQVTAQGAANTVLIANAGAPSFSASPVIGTSITVPLITTLSSGNLTIAPTGSVTFDPTGNQIDPLTNYDLNLGQLSKKYLTLHAAELWVETLVAQDTAATIGGRVLIGPTTVLTSDLAAAATSIVVKHNQMVSGDRVYLESNGKVEFLAITSAPSGSGPYTYTVTRNLDGTGANDWFAGDAVFNTGQTGNGFIDLYSIRGVKTSSQTGPTIVGNVRNSSTYNDWSERWAIGNLNGLYGYGTNIYGVAMGVPSAAWVKIDPTNGVRIGHNTTTLTQIDASGNASFTGTITAAAGSIAGWAIASTKLSKNEVSIAAGVDWANIAGTGEAWFGKGSTGMYGILLKGTTAAHLNMVAGHPSVGSDGRPYLQLNDGTRTRVVIGELNTAIWDGSATNSIGMKIWDSSGNLLVHFSSVANTISGWTIATTKISSTGIDIHSGANAALAFGTTPPTSASAGTGIWLDRTGLYGLNADAVQAKFDATGKLKAGGDRVIIDARGINIQGHEALPDDYDEKSAVNFRDSNTLLGAMYMGFGATKGGSELIVETVPYSGSDSRVSLKARATTSKVGSIAFVVQDNNGGAGSFSTITSSLFEIGTKLRIQSDSFNLTTAKTPASASATGTTGDIAWDTGFIYICTATNTWKRVAIATW